VRVIIGSDSWVRHIHVIRASADPKCEHRRGIARPAIYVIRHQGPTGRGRARANLPNFETGGQPRHHGSAAAHGADDLARHQFSKVRLPGSMEGAVVELSRRNLVVSRRAILSGVFGVLATGQGPSVDAATHVDIEYRGGSIYWLSGSARAAIGAGGVSRNKKEGDRATPAGTFSLPFGMYRPDRISLPRTDLPMTPLREAHGWVDDPYDPKYNHLVERPYPGHTEELWRADGIYDLLVVVGYNMNPTQPGIGSAIFLHIARPGFSPTEGYIAVSREVLLELIEVLGSDSRLTIRE